MKVIIFILFLLTFPIGMYAQKTYNFETKIFWDGTRNIQIARNSFKEIIYFKDAENISTKNFMPYFYKLVELDKEEVFETVDIIPLNVSFLDTCFFNAVDLNSISEEYLFFTEPKIIKRKNYVAIYILPLKKINKDNIILLNKFLLSVKTKKKKHKAPKAKTYAKHSLLQSGKWYKISVEENGIYKLTPNDFASMGLTVTNPQNIRIYSYGGGMLPEVVGDIDFDDLEENAIYVKGENDGRFDADDYVLFYGSQQNTWKLNKSEGVFYHKNNIYSKKTYYFINVDKGAGKRIETRDTETNSNQTITTFNDYKCIDFNQENIGKSGRIWLGELFDNTSSPKLYSFNFPNINKQETAFARIGVAAASKKTTHFSYAIDGNSYNSSSISASGDNPARINYDNYSFIPKNSKIDVQISYNNSNSKGWIDYLEINALRNLIVEGNQMLFRSIKSIDSLKTSKFIVSGASNNYTIWDITNLTNPINQNYIITSNNIEFALQTKTLKEFIIFNTQAYKTPFLEGNIPNQDIHGLAQCDMIIATHSNFIEEAQTLANYHTQADGLIVHVLELQQIYNEFSSGSQDISAIRNLMKMFYERSVTQGKMPKYLLLFGDASYDYLDKINDNTNFVPAYQSHLSLSSKYISYVTDDYFGILDDGEGGVNSIQSLSGSVDIGVGRIPVKTKEEAKDAVQKILWYTSKQNLVNSETNFSGQVSNLSDWKNSLCFISDFDNSNSYLRMSEELSIRIDTVFPNYNIDKIYTDAYKKVSTPGGNRYPEVQKAINNRFNKGALIINYIGHGGGLGLSKSRILGISDIENWTNKYNLPLFFTQTCELSRFDDPQKLSPGEMIFLKPNGGAIAMLTTTRPTYASHTMVMARVLFANAFKKENNRYKTIGELYQEAKSAIGVPNKPSLISLVLFGDPAVTLAHPQLNIVTTQINEKPLTSELDTIKALEKVSVKGYIEDNNFHQQADFNGVIYPTIYDKPTTFFTLGEAGNTKYPFSLQKNIIYRGKASVKNGEFEFSFYIPKDIAYHYGKGKISYYAENNNIDAKGYSKEFVIGGFNENTHIENQGPQINLFINDTNFINGGITDEDPVLLAYLSDEYGINTTGVGIGHNIKAILDGNLSNPINLNQFYEANLDSYSSGIVRYKFSELNEGKHTLELTAWDIFNNSSRASINFHVKNSENIVINKVKIFPNPFSEEISFEIEHNQAYKNMFLELNIFNPLGQIIRSFQQEFSSYGFLSQPIIWDGKDQTGEKVTAGIYYYTITLQNNKGIFKKYTDKIIKIK